MSRKLPLSFRNVPESSIPMFAIAVEKLLVQTGLSFRATKSCVPIAIRHMTDLMCNFVGAGFPAPLVYLSAPNRLVFSWVGSVCVLAGACVAAPASFAEFLVPQRIRPA